MPAVSSTQPTPNNGMPEQVDCAQAIAQGIDKQLNMRAALMRCPVRSGTAQRYDRRGAPTVTRHRYQCQ